jgi:hypothetical protein
MSERPDIGHRHVWHLLRGLLPWRLHRVCTLCGTCDRLW